jgi:hypothetical protein
MKSISFDDGQTLNISEEIYLVKDDKDLYVMISGVEDSPVPGYHFSEGWVTLCNIKDIYNKKHPNWIGFSINQISKVPNVLNTI